MLRRPPPKPLQTTHIRNTSANPNVDPADDLLHCDFHFFPISRDRDFWGHVDDAGNMSCAKLVADRGLYGSN